jgi:hypothetical protein
MTDWLNLISNAIRDQVADMERLGGIEQLLRMHLDEAQTANPAAESIAFRMAAEEVFEYELLSTLDLRKTRNLLDLAAAFKPAAAVPLLLTFLRENSRHEVIDRVGVLAYDLRRRALEALEAFFLAPPLRESTSYLAYLDILRQYATIPSYAGYCLARLIELYVTTTNDEMTSKLIGIATDDGLAELIDRVRDLNTETAANAQLSLLYRVAVSVGKGSAMLLALGGSVPLVADEVAPKSQPQTQIPVKFVRQAQELNRFDFRASLSAIPGVTVTKEL